MSDLHSENLISIEPIEIPLKKDDGDFQVLKTVMVSSTHVIHDTYAGFIAPLIPFLIERLSLLKVEAGFFLFLYHGTSILQPVIGHFNDRINLRKLALIAPAVTAIFLSLLGTAPSFYVALLYCFLAGISAACMHAILPALVGTLSGRQIGKGMSIWMVGGELGVMFGPIIITAVIASSSISYTPWLMIGGILASVMLSFLLKDIPHHHTNNGEKANIPFNRLARILLPMAAIVIMRSLLRAASEIFLPVFLTEKGAGVWLAGASLSILQGFGVLGVILGGLANDRIGQKPVMFTSIILSSIGMLVFINSNGILQLASLAFLGTASMMVLPVGMAVVQKNFPENRSLANGIYLALLFAVNAIAGVFTGFLYDQIGGHQTFLMGGYIYFLAIPFVFLLPKQEK